ncbi:sugar MFS transporter [Mitsuokella sp. AF21-1AC]|uniref:MFS transporter n=1 Tax=Mitsuokella sp. AF21-1AC TaxID=2292235 RepID=UPI000E5479B3|nr:MFS transporter [Mitsuokella sp. AF21-1AC]RGS71667.1 MFS transporter [Mitsuokella sp. AF21-1AC]
MVHLLLAIIYIAFISLGLPDSLLGAAWPVMHEDLGAPLSYAGIISMIIAFGTVVSSLQSDRLTLRLGTGKVTAISVAMTAAALFGFSVSSEFWMLCLWAVPYGLGAGGVDAALNNYVALHYRNWHMSWLHCMWGVGAATGPYIMGMALAMGKGWPAGYHIIAVMQVVLTIILFASLPLWKERKNDVQAAYADKRKPLSLREIFRIPGAREILVAFFCYSAVEQTCGLWASSFLNLSKGISAEQAASFGAMFFIGITVGRAINGFLAMRMHDESMIRMGQVLILLGIVTVMLPASETFALAGLILIGLGCAPIYPCIIHSTPAHFGRDKSQAIIGVQMAAAYIGTMLMPPLFGILANHLSISLLPIYLLVLLAIMAFMHERLIQKTR